MLNTHNKTLNFGKHRGELWTRVPNNYLRWLSNQPEELPGMEENKELARAELERRGTRSSGEVEISKHAIDTASLRVRKIWHQSRGENEGLYTWLSRIANEAVEGVNDKPERIKHLGIILIFKWGNDFPILKTVMRKK